MTKNLRTPAPAPIIQPSPMNKSFLVLFFKKEQLPFLSFVTPRPH
jgi:hypothetical protein